jgi:hypothetical protein
LEIVVQTLELGLKYFNELFVASYNLRRDLYLPHMVEQEIVFRERNVAELTTLFQSLFFGIQNTERFFFLVRILE